MKRRITEGMLGVAVLVILLLGIPLAIVVQRLVVDREVVALQSRASRTLAEVGIPLEQAELERHWQRLGRGDDLAVYDAEGLLRFGSGPRRADAPVLRALRGEPASTTSGAVVVASPVTERVSERVIGALRISAPRSRVDGLARRAWLVMLAAIAGAVCVAWLVARRISRSITQPLTALAATAQRLGDGEVIGESLGTGIDEIDALSRAFATSAEQVSESLARERRFTADVSHQLRTPLTRLRLHIEQLEADRGADAMGLVQGDLDQLEETLVHLLALARDSGPRTGTSDLAARGRAAVARWSVRARSDDRSLSIRGADDALSVLASGAALDQIIDVLVENALSHGRGAIALSVRRLPGGAAIDVADEGGIAGDPNQIFERRRGVGSGIGLALARALAEAEGGRLMCASAAPTVFTLALRRSEPREPGSDVAVNAAAPER